MSNRLNWRATAEQLTVPELLQGAMPGKAARRVAETRGRLVPNRKDRRREARRRGE